MRHVMPHRSNIVAAPPLQELLSSNANDGDGLQPGDIAKVAKRATSPTSKRQSSVVEFQRREPHAG
jgi:hypothetical protein